MYNFQTRVFYEFRSVEEPVDIPTGPVPVLVQTGYRPYRLSRPRTTFKMILHTSCEQSNQILKDFHNNIWIGCVETNIIKTSIFEAMRNKIIIKEICDIYQKLCFIINGGAVSGNG